MQVYRSIYWQVSLPAGWQVEQEEDSTVLYDPSHSGSIVISAVQEEQPITDEYIESLVEEHLDADAELYQVEAGDFNGLSCCYADTDEYWCEWYLRADKTLLFVTYNCSLPEEGSQDDIVEMILESLQVPAEKSLH